MTKRIGLVRINQTPYGSVNIEVPRNKAEEEYLIEKIVTDDKWEFLKEVYIDLDMAIALLCPTVNNFKKFIKYLEACGCTCNETCLSSCKNADKQPGCQSSCKSICKQTNFGGSHF